MMFHANVTIRSVGGELHYFVTLTVRRHGRACACGVLSLRGVNEWAEFCRVCDGQDIGVSIESEIQIKTSKTAAAD